MAVVPRLGSVRRSGGGDPLGGFSRLADQAVAAAASRKEDALRAQERKERERERELDRSADKAERDAQREADKAERAGQKDLTANSVTQFRWSIQQDLLSRDPAFFQTGQTEFTPQQQAARRAQVLRSTERMLAVGAGSDAARRMYIRREANLDAFALQLARPDFAPISNTEFEGDGSSAARARDRLERLPMPSIGEIAAVANRRRPDPLAAPARAKRAEQEDEGFFAGVASELSDMFTIREGRPDRIARTPDKKEVVAGSGLFTIYRSQPAERTPSRIRDLLTGFGGATTRGGASLVGAASYLVGKAETNVLAPAALFLEGQIRDGQKASVLSGGGSPQEQANALAEIDRQYNRHTKRTQQIADSGVGPVSQFLASVDTEISAWGDAAFDQDLLTDNAKRSQAEMATSLSNGDVPGAISAAWQRPDMLVANMVGFVVGAGGPVRTLGKGAVTGALALASGEDVSDSVGDTLRALSDDVFGELPATRRLREKMPFASDAEIRSAVIASQTEQARIIGTAGSLAGGMVGARSEMGLLAVGTVLKEARELAIERGIVPALVRGTAREAVGESIQGSTEAFATAVGSAGLNPTEATTKEYRAALAQGAFEGIIGGAVGGGLGALPAVGSAVERLQRRDEARTAMAEQIAATAATDPDVAEALANADESLAGITVVEAAVEQADALAILDPSADHNRVLDLASAERKLADAPRFPPAGSQRPLDSRSLSEGLELTQDEEQAVYEEVAADTAGTSVSDNPRADFDPQASIAAKAALHTADAYLNNARRAFTTGSETPDPASVDPTTGKARANLFTAEPEKQVDALIPVLQSTGQLPGLEVQAAQVLVAAGLGGPRGSVMKGRSVARRLAKLDPQMAGLVPAMDKIVSEYESVRTARNRIRDATVPPEAGRKPRAVPADFDLAADTGVLNDRLRSAGAPVVPVVNQIDRKAASQTPMVDAMFSEVDVSNRPTGKSELKRRKKDESETAWQKRVNRLRRNDTVNQIADQADSRGASQEPEHEPTRSMMRQIIGMTNDRSRVLEAQAMATEGQAEKAIYLAANNADVDETVAAARHEVDRLRSEFETKYLVPVVRAGDSFDTHAQQTLGVTADTARYIRENFALLTGVAGRARKKMYEVGYEHLKAASKLRVLDLATRQRNGLVTPDQFRGQMDVIFDDFGSYDTAPPGVKLAPDETSEQDIDTDDGGAPDSVLAQIRIDVSTEVAHKRGRPDVVTSESARQAMDAIRARLDTEGRARLDAYVAGLQEAYSATFDFSADRGLVDPAIAAYTEATGIKDNYIKHARVNDETGKALDNDYRFDDPVEGDQINFANTAYRSYMGKENVPAIADLNQTLRKHLAGVAIRASEARVMAAAANLAQLPGAQSKLMEVREARPPVLDPASGRWVYPDQPSVKDTNLFLVRDGASNRLITVKDPKLASQMRSAVVDQNQKSYDDTFGPLAPAFRGLGVSTRGLSRLMLLSVGYIRTAAFRDLTDNVSAAFTATANEPAGQATKAVIYGVGTALLASPKTTRYAFSGEQARAKMAERFKDSESPIEQAIYDLHTQGVFPNLRQEFGDLGTGAERTDNLIKRDKRSAPVRSAVDTWNATTSLFDKVLAMQDVVWRIVPYAAARQIGKSKQEALGVTEAVIRDAAIRAARQTVDFTVRPEYAETKYGNLFWTMLRSVVPFAYSQNAGFVSNLRNMYKDGQVPPPGTGVREHFEAIDKRKIAVATALGYASTQALISTTAALGSALVGEGEDEDDWLDQQFSAREVMRNNPLMTALGVSLGVSQRDIDGDGNTDIGIPSGPVGFSPLSFFSQVGAYAAMMANGVDREGATRAMGKAVVDSWSPIGVELAVGDVSQNSDAPFLWTMARNALGPLLGPAAGFALNKDESYRPIVEEGNPDNPTGAKISTPGAYGGFGGAMTPESQRYLLREFGGGPAQMIDQGLRDAETASKHPELEGALMRQAARYTWRGNEIDNVGRKYAQNDEVFENLYTPMKERVNLARAKDVAAGISPNATGPAVAAIANADPNAFAAYRTWGKYLGAKKELELQKYIPARGRGDTDTMGDVEVRIEQLRREAIAGVRKLYPKAFD